MHIKFFRHGTGDPQRAVRYLLADRDHNGQVRSTVKVLRGQPEIVAAVAATSTNVHRYTSGMIAWAAEDKPSEAEIDEVLNDFERLAFAGLDGDQYAFAAVLHGDHVHVFAARVELKTGKAMNIAPPGWSKDFDPLRDYWNHRMGWARPDDPERARHLQPGDVQKRRLSKQKQISQEAQELGISVSDLLGATGEEVDLKTIIGDHLLRLVVEGDVKNRKDVLALMEKYGEVTRAGEDYISIKPPQASKAERFKGALFRRDFDGVAFLRTYQKPATSVRSAPDPVRAEAAKREMDEAIRRRAAYNARRYSRPEPQFLPSSEPSAMGAVAEDLFITVVKEDTNADGNTDDSGGTPEGPVGHARAAFERLVAAGQRAVAAFKSLEFAVESALRAFDWFEARRTRMGLVLAEQRERASRLGEATRDIDTASPGSSGSGGSSRPTIQPDSGVTGQVDHCIAAIQRAAERTDRVGQQLVRATGIMRKRGVNPQKHRPDSAR